MGNYDDATATIFAVARNCVIENNYLHDQVNVGNWYVDPAFSGFHGTGIQFKDGSYNNIIRDNVIHYTYYPAILVSGATASPFSAGDTIGPNIIERNVIWEISRASGDITGQGIQCAADVTLRNNIIYAPQPLRFQKHQLSTPHAIQVVSNTLVSTSSDTLQISQYARRPRPHRQQRPLPRPRPHRRDRRLTAAAAAWVTKVANVAILDLAAALTNPAGLNFFPTAASPLGNAASAAYQPVDDFNKMVRNSDLTVGAYAYNAARQPGLDHRPRLQAAPGDVDFDGHVDVSDLLYLVDAFGTSFGEPAYNPACDFNADNSVDVSDLLYLVENFGT